MINRYPAAFGFTNTTDPCYQDFGDKSVCPEPDKYWFWDSGHPTTRAQHILSNFLVLELVKAKELK